MPRTFSSRPSVCCAAVLCCLVASGCNSLGIGVTIPIGPVGVTIGGSIPLPQRTAPPQAGASAPASSASAPSR